MKSTQCQMIIDDSLRFFLFGLQCLLGVTFSGSLCDKVFQDSREDSVSEKAYSLHQGRRLKVTAWVEDYEPETIWIKVVGKAVDLDSLAKAAGYESFRMRQFNDL